MCTGGAIHLTPSTDNPIYTTDLDIYFYKIFLFASIIVYAYIYIYILTTHYTILNLILLNPNRYARELNNVEVNSRPTTTPVTQIVHTTNKTTETKIISDCEIFLNIPIMKELKTKRPRFNFTLTPWNIHMDNIRSPELNSSKQGSVIAL